MTAGHKHRHLLVKRNGLVRRVLTATVLTTTDTEWVDRSRLVFGPVEDTRREPRPPRPETYRLSLLGLLHGLFGLTLVIKPEEETKP